MAYHPPKKKVDYMLIPSNFKHLETGDVALPHISGTCFKSSRPSGPKNPPGCVNLIGIGGILDFEGRRRTGVPWRKTKELGKLEMWVSGVSMFFLLNICISHRIHGTIFLHEWLICMGFQVGKYSHGPYGCDLCIFPVRLFVHDVWQLKPKATRLTQWLPIQFRAKPGNKS